MNLLRIRSAIFFMPMGIAPNFLINDKLYAIPMVIEESSVVAAASKAAKFWQERGGFKAKILGTEKIGQVHFIYHGDSKRLEDFIHKTKPISWSDVKDITKNMEKRGGGVTHISLRDKRTELDGYFQLHCTFETMDAMGANFIKFMPGTVCKNTFKGGKVQYRFYRGRERDRGGNEHPV